MRGSRLPSGGENVLQTIRAKRAEAEARGIKLTDLSIGEPKGAALLSARKAAAEAVMSDEEAMHAYQYNASPGVPNFAPRFIRAHVNRELNADEVDYLPIPGIKPDFGVDPAFLWLRSAKGGGGYHDRPRLPHTRRLVRNLRPRRALSAATEPREPVPLLYRGYRQRDPPDNDRTTLTTPPVRSPAAAGWRSFAPIATSTTYGCSTTPPTWC